MKNELGNETKVPAKDEEKLKQLGKTYLKDKEAEGKQIIATKEWLFGRSERKYPIPVDMGDDGERIFYARRLNEKERLQMASVKNRLGMIDPMEMSEEEFAQIQKQGYELLEISIVDPKLTQDEWEMVDLALVQYLLEKINILQIEVNDAKAIDDLRNL